MTSSDKFLEVIEDLTRSAITAFLCVVFAHMDVADSLSIYLRRSYNHSTAFVFRLKLRIGTTKTFIVSKHQSFPTSRRCAHLPIKVHGAYFSFSFLLVFLHCPFLAPYKDQREQIYASFSRYKMNVPTCGAIILNEKLDKVACCTWSHLNYLFSV